MTDTTEAPYSIPYLEPSEPADIPYAGQIMAERVTAVFKDMPYGKMWKATGAQPYTTPGVAVLVTMSAARVVGGVTWADAADTLTVPMAGLYRVEGGIYVAPSAASYAAARVLRNGAQLDYYQQPTATSDLTVRGWIETNLNAGDVLSLQAVVGVAANLNGAAESSACFLSARWMRPTL